MRRPYILSYDTPSTLNPKMRPTPSTLASTSIPMPTSPPLIMERQSCTGSTYGVQQTQPAGLVRETFEQEEAGVETSIDHITVPTSSQRQSQPPTEPQDRIHTLERKLAKKDRELKRVRAELSKVERRGTS